MAYWLFGLPVVCHFCRRQQLPLADAKGCSIQGAVATWKLRSVGGLYTGLAAAVVLATVWMTVMIWRNHWDARAAEAMARISIQDSDAKVIHTPPNERDGLIEEVIDDEDDEHDTALNPNNRSQV